ncbi:MAG: MaoC family dehydratase [Burkholderiales bacterium]|nr:MaoC family dehydratase [Burkholderiales bacterium]
MDTQLTKTQLTLDTLPNWLGRDVGPSDWLTITQERINQFAEATGDHQWIHVDAERAAKESPFGATVAHGYLTLSLMPMFKEQCMEYANVKMGVNYGTNRVRFMSPVKVNSRVRGRFKLLEVETIKGGVQVVWEATVEIDGLSKPACVAELVARIYA